MACATQLYQRMLLLVLVSNMLSFGMTQKEIKIGMDCGR
jgi:hypothetical protein